MPHLPSSRRRFGLLSATVSRRIVCVADRVLTERVHAVETVPVRVAEWLTIAEAGKRAPEIFLESSLAGRNIANVRE